MRAGLLTRLIRTRPLLVAALLFMGGCIFSYAYQPPLYACLIAFVAIALSALAARGRRGHCAVLALLCLLPLGALRFGLAWNALAPIEAVSGAAFSARVCETPVWDAQKQRTICVLDELKIDGAPVDGRIRLYLRGEDAAGLQAIALGQRLSGTANLRKARPASNYGQFDFADYLRIEGLRGYATADLSDCAPGEVEYRASDLPARLRARIGARIDRLFPKHADVVRAFILADRSRMNEDERESYRRSGAAHLLAVSGMHISLLALMLNFALGRFLRRQTAFAVTLTLLTAYGALIGFSASVTRALVMFAVLGFAPLAARVSDAPTRLAAALLLCLLLRPVDLLESGFALSFAATAGIIFLRAPLGRLVRADRLDLRGRSPARRIAAWAVETLLMSLAAQLAILPALAHHFGAQPIWSPAVSLLATPLAMAAYALAILGALSGLAPIAAAADFGFGLLSGVVRLFGGMELTAVRIARFPIWLTLLCALACFLASDLCRLPARLRSWLPTAVLVAALASNGLSCLSARGVSIVFLDAGQADCAVLRCEGKVYLIDTGDAYTPVGDYLSAMNYPLEAVFLTHPHDDHCGGLSELLKVSVPETIYLSSNWDAYAASEAIEAALEAARTLGVRICTLGAGDRLRLSEAVRLEVLAPEAQSPAASANDDSLVLALRYDRAVALFCGDASASLLEDCACDADLIKVAHHGSVKSLSPALLERVSPSVALISVGENSYGHPSRETIELLQSAGARIFRTDECGALDCRLYADGSVRVRGYFAQEDANDLG